MSGADSELHDEPHLPDSRLTVRDIHARVEKRGYRPATIADRFNVDIAAVYEALAYYYANPKTMRAVEQRHETAVDAARERSSPRPPETE